MAPPVILDRKVVAENDQYRMEWQLHEDKTNDLGSIWKPFMVDSESDAILHTPEWMPLPGSQTVFLQCPVFEALFEGNRGPGKSITLLMDFAKEVGKGYGKAWRGVLFRRSFGDLEDIVRKIEDTFPRMFPGFKFLKSKSEYAAVWPGGETLLLRHLRGPDDYAEFHGHEIPWIGWEELTQWENDIAYKMMMSCSRPPAPGVPCRVRGTTNPHGVGHSWVKKRFNLGDLSTRGQVIKVPGEMPRVAIRGDLRENFLLLHSQPTYPMQIKQAARNNAQAAAWLEGDWNVTSGGMFDDIWDSNIHVIPDIPYEQIPHGWILSRGYDHGRAHPFAYQLWAESNGEPLQLKDGRIVGNVRGDKILLMEWYGTNGNVNEGLNMSARRIAQGILDRESDYGVTGRVYPGPADTEIWTMDNRGTGRCPANDMEDVGVYWERADKASGSRKAGFEVVRNYIEGAIPDETGFRETSGLFVCSGCRYWLELCPTVPRDKDDPDEIPKGYEDHQLDCTRYVLTYDLPRMWRKSGF